MGKAKKLNDILSNLNFLLSCWYKIKYKKIHFIPITNNLQIKWFKKTALSLKNKTFDFKIFCTACITKPNFKTHSFFVFSPKIKIIEEGIYFLLKVVYEPIFFLDYYFNTARQKYQKIFKDIRSHNESVSWYLKSINNNKSFVVDCCFITSLIKKKIKDKAFTILLQKYIKKINFNFCLKDSNLLQTILIDIYVHSLDKQFANNLKFHSKSCNEKYFKTTNSCFTFKQLSYFRHLKNFTIGIN